MSPTPTLYGSRHQHREAGGQAIRPLEGGVLCLDFINTVSSHDGRPAEDDLSPGYVNLVEWCAAAGAIGDELATSLLRRATRDPREAAAVRRRALELRAALHGIVTAIHTGVVPHDHHLDLFNGERQHAERHVIYRSGLESDPAKRVAERQSPPADGITHAAQLVREWDTDGEIDRLLWPIVEDAAAFLASSDMDRVRACAAPDCARWFHDDSRNHTRKYCSSRGCGTVDRVRRFRARQTGATA